MSSFPRLGATVPNRHLQGWFKPAPHLSKKAPCFWHGAMFQQENSLLRQTLQDCVGLSFLLLIAFQQHFLQNFTAGFDIAGGLIRAGEVELGGRVVPLSFDD